VASPEASADASGEAACEPAGQRLAHAADPRVEMHHVAAAAGAVAEVDRAPGQAGAIAQGDHQIPGQVQEPVLRAAVPAEVGRDQPLAVPQDLRTPPLDGPILRLPRLDQRGFDGRTQCRRILGES